MFGPSQSQTSDVHAGVGFSPVRSQDRIAARIRVVAEDGEYLDCRVWALNPFGIEIVLPPRYQDTGVGGRIQIDLVLFGQRSKFDGVVAEVSNFEGDQRLATIRFLYEAPERGKRPDRSSTRWLCSDKFLPVAVAPSPTYFDDWMYFHVREISREGMQLSTSLRNKYLLPGTTLKLAIMFPASGNTTVQYVIKRVGVISAGSTDLLLLGGGFVGAEPKTRVVIGQYLVQFAPQVALDELRQADFLPESLFRGVSIRYAKSEDEYRRVLSLRYEANRVSNQLGTAKSADDLSEADDARSRILLATRGDDSVATVRIRFPGLEDRIEAEKYVTWPSSLPRRDNVFEVSRLAISPSYRGKDVLPSIFHYIALSAIGSDRPWITVSAMNKYVDFYKKIGFVQTGLRYTDPRWSNELNVMVLHAMDAMKGKGTNILYWYSIWSPVLRDFERDGVVSLKGMDRIRVASMRILGKVAHLFR